MGPRNSHQRQRQQDRHSSHTLPIQVSDYESEPYPQHQQQHQQRQRGQGQAQIQTQSTTRSNTTLNLGVLRRYYPSIQSIISIAASAVIYNFTPPASWDKSNIEGTLFVCELGPHPTTGAPGYAVVVLNRRGLDSFMLDVAEMQDVEITDQYLILSYLERTESWDMQRRIVGVFMHADKDDTREINSLLIKQCWESLRHAGGDPAADVDEATITPGGMEKQLPGMGRKLSLRDLFAKQQSMR